MPNSIPQCLYKPISNNAIWIVFCLISRAMFGSYFPFDFMLAKKNHFKKIFFFFFLCVYSAFSCRMLTFHCSIRLTFGSRIRIENELHNLAQLFLLWANNKSNNNNNRNNMNSIPKNLDIWQRRRCICRPLSVCLSACLPVVCRYCWPPIKVSIYRLRSLCGDRCAPPSPPPHHMPHAGQHFGTI